MALVANMPDWLEPMAATLTQDRFVGPDWIFEQKFDGIRLLAYKRDADVQLYSRNRLPQDLPALAKAIATLPVHEVILDGEVTWDGRSAYHVFDILWLDGQAVTALPLEERRALLQELPFEPPMRRVDLVEDQVHASEYARPCRKGWRSVGRYAPPRAIVETADGEATPTRLTSGLSTAILVDTRSSRARTNRPAPKARVGVLATVPRRRSGVLMKQAPTFCHQQAPPE